MSEKPDGVEKKEQYDERLSRVSHEMRTPLNAVLGMSDMILRATDGGDVDISEIHSFARDIKNAGEELLHLTNDYLYISDVRPDQTDISAVSADNDNDREASDGRKLHALSLKDGMDAVAATHARILVADDNSVNRRVFKNLLKETGMTIDEAEGGFECIAKAAENAYDMIFLDYMMPDLDGIQTLEKIREEDGINHGTPIIVLTANTTSFTREKLEKCGFEGILSKPVIYRELEGVIAKYLSFGDDNEITDGYQNGDQRDAGKGFRKKGTEGKENRDIGTEYKGAQYKGAVHADDHSDQLVAIDIARVYANDKEELEGYYRDIQGGGGFDQYAVKIHSMKTSALMVKAYEPWALAKSLEDAAENENGDFIASVHPVFLKSWMQMGEQLEKDYLYAKERKRAHTPEYEIILGYLRLLKEAVEKIDISSADTLMEMLRSYWYPEELVCLISRLNAAVAGLDAEAVGKYVTAIGRIINENYIADRKDR